MKRRSHKGLISAVVATAFASLLAVPVTCDQARTAVGNWLRSDPALGCRLGQSVDSARTCTTTNGANFHVVRLAGGGFVVTSADTTQEPVVAFSDSPDLVESANNPLWGILQHDFSRRMRTTNAAPRAVSAPTVAEARWAALLSNAPVARGGNGAVSVSDLRVDEIIRSKWGQTVDSVWDNWSEAENCYNLFTPNNYPCGCVATVMAQIMRLHNYPSSAKVVTRTCKVEGVLSDFTTSGTPYEWANMPLIPEHDWEYEWYDGGSTPEERAAIGKLTYECGIAMQMQWEDEASASYGAFAFEPLTNVFRFANARSYLARNSGNLSADLIKQIMLPNLDAGYPVMLGIAAHEVIADGYGFSDGQLYTHLNMGWSGTDNAWYNLPYVEPAEIDYSSSIVNHITYNIFTNETGELLSGRVVDADGNPIENALVLVSSAPTSTTSGGTTTTGGTTTSGDTVLATTLTNGRGIYFFRLPGASRYRVTASVGALSQTLSDVWLPRSINPSRVNLLTSEYNAGNMAAGNCWGNDFVFNGIASVATPEFNPPPGLFHPSTSVFISCQTSGATIRYTLDGSDPDATSPEFWASSPIVVTADTTIKARAFKDGLNPSAIVTATYTYDISKDAPIGDYYADPIVISGTEGTYTVSDNSSYTLETGEPYHSNYYQYHSIWYSWTAPGSGTMTFNGYAAAGGSIYPSIMAVYVGETMATAERMAFGTDYLANSDYSTSVSFTVEQGVTYHIVNAMMDETWLAPVRVSWSGDLTITSDPSVPTEPRTLYVNAAVPATSQQDGLTPTTAFHDLPAAMAILQDGDTVLVAPGTYSPAVVTAGNVTIRATGAVAETIIDGGGTSACCSVDLENDSASGAFEGFTLVNGGGVDFANENGVRYCRGGGALFVTLTRCVISNCVAEVGGGAHGCDLRNCLIACNMADYYAGGASECVLVGCTVAGNSAEEYCGGIDCDSVATNCIVWGNAVDDGSSPDFENSDYGAPQLAYSCSSSLAAGDGNLAADPKFRDAAAGDFRLRLVSPCLDVATLADISSTETDLSGNPRIQGGAPDMGAYEGGFAIAAIQLLSTGHDLYSAAAQTGYAAFACDSNWQVSCDADWISFPVAFGSGDREAFGFTLAANPADVARCATVSLVDGANNIVSFQVRQAAAALPPAVTNRYFGLFVGLNEYDAVALRRLGFVAGSLTGSVLDATNVCARFTNWGFCRREDALVLTNNLATVSSIRTAMTNIAAQAVAGDTVLYYHSGHGYLSTGTTVALVGYAGFYWDYDLAADLGLFADGVRVVVMADTCHSGGLFKGAGTRGRRTFNLAERVQSLMSASRSRGAMGGTSATPRNLVAPAQIGWITAADYNQSSWDTDLGGKFTVACLEGWRTGAADTDGDGLINFYEMYRYAKDAAAEDTTSYGEETEAQCFNEMLLFATLAGKTDAYVSRDMSFAQVEVDCRDVTYNGSAIEPQITSVSINGNLLSRDTDFDVLYSGNVNAGKAAITLVGIGSFTGTYTTNFVIKAKTLTDEMVFIEDALWIYDGTVKEPAVVVADGDPSILTETDYVVDYFDNVKAGTTTAKIQVTGKRNYTGTVTKRFSIAKAAVTPPKTVARKVYTGGWQTADISATGCYMVQNDGGVDVGTYPVTLVLADADNYCWKDGDSNPLVLTFEITQAANSWITQPSITDWTYGQAANAPNMGEAKFGTTTVAYSGVGGGQGAARPTEPGEYIAVFAVAETANWSGLTKEVPFKITAAEEAKLEEAFDGLPVGIEPDGNGGWIVTITNDIDAADLPIEISGNIGNMTIDLNGCDLVGPDGQPVIVIVPGKGDGEPTQITIVNSGDDATVKGGKGVPAIEVADGAQDGVLINIGEGVTVQGGGHGVPAVIGDIGTNNGIIEETMPPWPTDGAYNPLVANVYDGYIVDGAGALAGIIQVKAAKQAVKTVTDKVTKVKTATTNVAVTATVTDVAGKKWSYKGDGTVDGVVTGLVCTTKGVLVPSFGVTLGANGLEGEWGDFTVEGARNGMGTKGDAMMTELDANYKKSWSVSLTNELGATRLQLVVGAKGSTKISGVTPDGYKISATVQGIMGEDAFFVPYLATLKNGKLTRPANLLLTLGRDGTVVARTSDLGGLKAAGPTTDEIEVLPYAASESSKGGEAYAGAVVLNELAYPAKFAAKGLPAGLKIDAATGAITGIPTKPGRYTATITITSGVNGKKKVEAKVDFDIANYTDDAIGIEDSYSGYCVGVMACERITGALDCAVSGLPAGLKFAAKETNDKTFGTVAAGTVYGVPTKAGEYTVYFKKTEKVNGKSVTRQASATFKVKALPAWAQGTFDGNVKCKMENGELGDGGEGNVPEARSTSGLVTLTVDAKGKISGKLIDADGTWTLSAVAYEWVEGLKLENLEGLDNLGNLDNLVFHATVIGKNGKLLATNEVTVAMADAARSASAPYQRGVVSGWTASEPSAAAAEDCRPLEWTAWQNLWKTEPWKTYAKDFAKAPKLSVGAIEFKFAASGAVTAKYGAYSCSATLIPMPTVEGTFSAFLYFPPKAGKFDGYGTEILFVWDGGKKEFLLAE